MVAPLKRVQPGSLIGEWDGWHFKGYKLLIQVIKHDELCPVEGKIVTVFFTKVIANQRLFDLKLYERDRGRSWDVIYE